MLSGETIGLRARQDADVAVLHAELYEDVTTRSRADLRPWRPIGAGSPASPYAVPAPSDDAACFSVVTLTDDELAGEALLWGIDHHNRAANIGVSLSPGFRGRGISKDVIHVLRHYGFDILGLHRLQIETLIDNEPMIHAATASGFAREGTRRHGRGSTGVSWIR